MPENLAPWSQPRSDFVLKEASREETGKTWDCIVSDEIVYAAKPLHADLEIRNGISRFDWLSKYDSGDFYIELKFVFFGERDTYFDAIIRVVPPSCGNRWSDGDFKKDMAHGNDLMLVDVTKSIQLPKGMVLERRPSFIRLKRFDDAESSRKDVSDFFLIAPITEGRTLGIDRETRLPSRFIGSEQSKLPSQMVKARTESIGEFSDKHTYRVGRDFLFDVDTIPRILHIVLSRDEVGIFPKFRDFPIQFVEAFVRPTQFHLRVGQPDAHRPHDTSLY